MSKDKYVQVCPICGSKKFNLYNGDQVTNIAGREIYKCDNCKNIFSFPIELLEKDAKKIKPLSIKELGSNTPEGTFIAIGKFEVGVYWKILGIILLLIGLSFLFTSTLPILCHTDSISEELVCVENTNSGGFIATGVAAIFAGIYLLIESIIVFRTQHKVSRAVKILLALGFFLTVYLVGYPFIFFLP